MVLSLLCCIRKEGNKNNYVFQNHQRNNERHYNGLNTLNCHYYYRMCNHEWKNLSNNFL